MRARHATCCFSHFRGSNVSRPLRLAPKLLDLLFRPQKSLDHAREQGSLFGRELAAADRRNYRGNGDRRSRSLLEQRQIDLDGRTFTLREDHPHQAAECPGIARFRLLDELVSERLAIALDELLQEDGCLVACAARAPGWIAALAWLEGHVFSPLLAGTKSPRRAGIAGNKKPGTVTRPGACSESSCFYMSRSTSGKRFVDAVRSRSNQPRFGRTMIM
jgi:hypothetical protein